MFRFVSQCIFVMIPVDWICCWSDEFRELLKSLVINKRLTFFVFECNGRELVWLCIFGLSNSLLFRGLSERSSFYGDRIHGEHLLSCGSCAVECVPFSDSWLSGSQNV